MLLQLQNNLLGNKRVILAVLAVILAVVILIVSLTTRSQAPTTPTSNGTVSYTNAITGQSGQDHPGQSSVQGEVSVGIPSVTIDGFANIFNYMTNDQAGSTQATINNFLLAQSGLANVSAGIKDNVITRIDSQAIQFTLVVLRPQSTYQVTIQFANQSQTVPTVTFKQVK